MQFIPMKAWLVFVWSALFAGVAALLEAAMKHMRNGTIITSGLVVRIVVETLVVAWWGGLAGWVINLTFPRLIENTPELLGVVAAILGRGGLTFSRAAVVGMVENMLKIKLSGGEEEE